MPRPKKFYDETGLCRVTLKKGSPRQPGGERPHAQYVQSDGRRVNAMGLPVTRASVAAFPAIKWDFEDDPDDDLGESGAEQADAEEAAVVADSVDFAEVAQLAFHSPTLYQGMQSLDAMGFALAQGPTSEANQVIVAACRVLVDPALTSRHTVTGVVAREIGRALFVQPKVSARGRDRESFAAENAEASLREEGEAIVFAATVRREIIAGGGPDVGVPGLDGDALRLAEDASTGAVSRAEAVVALGLRALAPEHDDARARYVALWARVYDLLMGVA